MTGGQLLGFCAIKCPLPARFSLIHLCYSSISLLARSLATQNPHRAVSKYAIFAVAALFIAALVVSILVNDKFRKPFGPKPA
jgi:hypothetical protein